MVFLGLAAISKCRHVGLVFMFVIGRPFSIIHIEMFNWFLVSFSVRSLMLLTNIWYVGYDCAFDVHGPSPFPSHKKQAIMAADVTKWWQSWRKDGFTHDCGDSIEGEAKEKWEFMLRTELEAKRLRSRQEGVAADWLTDKSMQKSTKKMRS